MDLRSDAVAPVLADETGRALLVAARESLAAFLGRREAVHDPRARVTERGSSFVTLRQQGELRGCVGTVDFRRPLFDDVTSNAIAAATSDPRFEPMRAAELADTDVELTVLGRPEPLAVRDEPDAIAKIVPGEDGIILQSGWHRGVFLPQVWETLPDPREFLASLKHKAGLAPHAWPAGIALERFRVRHWP